MWDLQKTMNHVAGVRRRIAKGLPPFTMTPEERAKSDKVHAEIRAEQERFHADLRAKGKKGY